MTNYQTALRRIANAKTTKDLQKVEAGLTRVYDAGFFTKNDFITLGVLFLMIISLGE